MRWNIDWKGKINGHEAWYFRLIDSILMAQIKKFLTQSMQRAKNTKVDKSRKRSFRATIAELATGVFVSTFNERYVGDLFFDHAKAQRRKDAKAQRSLNGD